MKKQLLLPLLMLACLLAAGGSAHAQGGRNGRNGRNNQYLQYSQNPQYSYAAFGGFTGELTNYAVIAARDMFDQSRYPQVQRAIYTNPPIVRVDSFTLVGTMSYEKGQYAFFDSNSRQYQKTLKTSDTIAGYKIAQIASDYIRLVAPSNRVVNLPVGAGMRRYQNGPWTVSSMDQPMEQPMMGLPAPGGEMPAPPFGGPITEPGAAPMTPAATTPTTAAPNDAAAADALKRLMLRRMQEK